MPSPPGPAVLALVGDFIASALYRVIWPGNALQARGYPAYSCPRDEPRMQDIVQGWNPLGRPLDAVILPRMYWRPDDQARAEHEIGEQQRAGQAVIAEWDDDAMSPASYGQFHLLEPDVPDAALEAERLARLHALRLADGATVSTPYLAAVLQQYTDRPVLVVPNALDWAAFRGVYAATPRTVPGLTIGWGGGKRLDHDLAPLATAWGRIAARFPAVQFVVAGYLPDLLRAAVPPERLHAEPWRDMGQFPASYRNIDIGCCPLAAVPFNRAKSLVKALEYGAAGCAVVYSPTVYGHGLRHQRDGLEAETAADWEAALGYLIEQPGARHALGRRWQRRVQARHTTATTCWQWPVAWQTLVTAARARRPKLVAV